MSSHSDLAQLFFLPLYASTSRGRTCLYRPSAPLQDNQQRKKEEVFILTDGELYEPRAEIGKGATSNAAKRSRDRMRPTWETTMNPKPAPYPCQ